MHFFSYVNWTDMPPALVMQGTAVHMVNDCRLVAMVNFCVYVLGVERE